MQVLKEDNVIMFFTPFGRVSIDLTNGDIHINGILTNGGQAQRWLAKRIAQTNYELRYGSTTRNRRARLNQFKWLATTALEVAYN